MLRVEDVLQLVWPVVRDVRGVTDRCDGVTNASDADSASRRRSLPAHDLRILFAAVKLGVGEDTVAAGRVVVG
jgi:hypothetical protein